MPATLVDLRHHRLNCFDNDPITKTDNTRRVQNLFNVNSSLQSTTSLNMC